MVSGKMFANNQTWNTIIQTSVIFLSYLQFSLWIQRRFMEIHSSHNMNNKSNKTNTVIWWRVNSNSAIAASFFYISDLNATSQHTRSSKLNADLKIIFLYQTLLSYQLKMYICLYWRRAGNPSIWFFFYF